MNIVQGLEDRIRECERMLVERDAEIVSLKKEVASLKRTVALTRRMGTRGEWEPQ